jgi:hypothetical protein
MKPVISVKKTLDNLSAIHRAVSALTEQDVYIGVPAVDGARGDIDKKNHGQQARSNGGINNAYLGYIHEYGAPSQGIPPRPHLVPGIKDVQPEIAKILKDAAAKALQGNEQAVENALNRIGLLGQNAVRARFINNDWPPLKPATLARYIDPPPPKAAAGNPDQPEQPEQPEQKAGKKKKPKKRTTRADTGKLNPLIVSGQLRKSYTYVIRKRGAQMVIK